jgi:hypothetical protein
MSTRDKTLVIAGLLLVLLVTISECSSPGGCAMIYDNMPYCQVKDSNNSVIEP